MGRGPWLKIFNGQGPISQKKEKFNHKKLFLPYLFIYFWSFEGALPLPVPPSSVPGNIYHKKSIKYTLEPPLYLSLSFLFLYFSFFRTHYVDVTLNKVVFLMAL
jgi:hypothetical protein